MIWTATTPLYLPLTYGDPILLAAQRLADDVAAQLGARPELRPQPAPFGQPAILISPDPAYTSAVAPEWPQTFVAQTDGPELTVTGADSLGTILGLAWLSYHVLSRGEGPSREVDLRFELPRWVEQVRAWTVGVNDLPAPDLCWELLRHGGNTLAVCPELTAEAVAAAKLLGLRTQAVDQPGDCTSCWW